MNYKNPVNEKESVNMTVCCAMTFRNIILVVFQRKCLICNTQRWLCVTYYLIISWPPL